MSFHGLPLDGVAQGQVVAAYNDALNRLAENGLQPRTLQRIVRRQLRRLERSRDNIEVRARDAARWIANQLAPPTVADQSKALGNINPATLNLILAAINAPRRVVIGHALPGHGGPKK